MTIEKDNRPTAKQVASSVAAVLLALLTFVIILWAITAIVTILLSVKF